MTEEKLKLIWDFRGPDAEPIAKHHAIHLKEYLNSHEFSPDAGFEKISDIHSIAFLIICKSKMPVVRDDLKPHRGQLIKPEF